MNNQVVIKYNSLFLGGSIFLFGVLKFVDPFKSWYLGQITMSNLPISAYWGGIVGEIVFGIILAIPFISSSKIIQDLKKHFLSLGSFALVGMMIVATYVHLHPGVSADVLPLKIKPPFIPMFFLVLASINLIKVLKLGRDLEQKRI